MNLLRESIKWLFIGLLVLPTFVRFQADHVFANHVPFRQGDVFAGIVRHVAPLGIPRSSPSYGDAVREATFAREDAPSGGRDEPINTRTGDRRFGIGSCQACSPTG